MSTSFIWRYCLIFVIFVLGFAGLAAVNETRALQLYIERSAKSHVPLVPSVQSLAAPHAQTTSLSGSVASSELALIRVAADRNKCSGSLFTLLLAVHRAENGPAGREFGVMNPKAVGLDAQAGWAAATIVKNHQRWIEVGEPDDFITFLGEHYCPAQSAPLNRNWIRNVSFWYRSFGGDEID